MKTLFSEYPTINGVNSAKGTIKVLIAPTTENDSEIRFNIVQKVDGECKANVCALMTKETVKLFVHHLTSSYVSELPKCMSCGGTLEVL